MKPQPTNGTKILVCFCCCFLLTVTNLYAGKFTAGNRTHTSKEWPDAPGFTATTIAASTVTVSSVATGVTVAGAGTMLEKGIVYSTTTNPTTANTKVLSSGTATGTFAISITGLLASTTYHVRGYVTSSGGTVYGADMSFTTLSLPVITAQPVGGAICGTGTINLSVNATGTGTLSYQWKKAATNTGTNSNMLSATSAGSYTVVVTDNNGSSTSQAVAVTVTAVPSAPATRDTIICRGSDVTLTAAGSGTLGWYDAATGGNYLGGGSSYPTTVLNSSISFYVQDSSCAASAERSVINVTVNDPLTYYRDADGDGFGDISSTIVSCSGTPTGYVENSTDCDDLVAVLNPAVFGNNRWNVYAYDGSDFQNYRGYYIDINTNFNTNDYWEQNGTPSDAAGYIGCTVPVDGHSYRAKRKGFAPGCYIIDLPGHDDNTALYIDGVMVFRHDGCCDSHSQIWTGELNENSEVVIDLQEGGGQSYAVYTFLLAGAGEISGNQEVCLNALPADVILTGVSGNIRWQSSPDNVTFTDIPGESDSVLTGSSLGVMTNPFYIRAIATVGSCSDTSALVHLTPVPLPVVSITGTSTGYDSVTLTASGGVDYLWTGGNSPNTAINTFDKSNGYSVQVSGVSGCNGTATITVYILRMGLDKYGATVEDSASHISSNGAVGTSLSINKNGKITNASAVDGKSPSSAGSSAWQIKKDFPASADGLYWIKNNSINGGTPFQIYADMTTDGGGWTLILCNTSPNPGWDGSNALLRNENSPGINGTYSIIGWADYIKRSASGFQYMMDAETRRSYGGIWTANNNYSFVSTDNFNTNITLNIKFGDWNYSDDGIEERMPWYAPGAEGIITTSQDPNGSWWGTLVARNGWNPAPWLGCCSMPHPGVIWYWVR